ncbi:hypothetical protein LV779_38605 [Streptomyces thinghirensis]|nr:hypothetical protein [Streptomyces thinghirensis]
MDREPRGQSDLRPSIDHIVPALADPRASAGDFARGPVDAADAGRPGSTYAAIWSGGMADGKDGPDGGLTRGPLPFRGALEVARLPAGTSRGLEGRRRPGVGDVARPAAGRPAREGPRGSAPGLGALHVGLPTHDEWATSTPTRPCTG